MGISLLAPRLSLSNFIELLIHDHTDNFKGDSLLASEYHDVLSRSRERHR